MNSKKKTCFDCLHCKVSAVKVENKTYYFCAMKKNRMCKEAKYWLEKKLCMKFDDMGDEQSQQPRRLLLRKRFY